MSQNFVYAEDSRQSGRLASNVLHFIRVLRKAGLKLGPASVVEALDAVTLGPIRARADFYWVLHAVLVKRREDHVVFDQAFHVFWRKPKMLEELLQLLRIDVMLPPSERQRKQAATMRLAESYFASVNDKFKSEEQQQVEIQASHGASSEDMLRHRDFEQMSIAELAQAKAALRLLKTAMRPKPTRRWRGACMGPRIDLRQSLRLALRNGGEMVALAHKEPKEELPPLVVLCDISGSCAEYSRMFLHFLHALMAVRPRLHVFTFGSRLTNITRDLARRDVDEAVATACAHVQDWSGGTRIGACLKEFNFKWARRVMGSKAELILLSDGLERDDIDVLETEIVRLARNTAHITWLNPLLRFDGFAAQALGIRTIMPHVDSFQSVHNLTSIEDLARRLARRRRPPEDLKKWLEEVA
jgi:uncharacterized protein